ncbi:MAG: hypothetical protein GC151_13655 [Betaproteobacteria bacterium]|nr:hypothetical protein [Betaproteobacteria bacterium]
MNAPVRKLLGMWCLASLAIHLPWEIGHLPLYTVWRTGSIPELAFDVAHCTIGDALISLCTFVAAGAVLRSMCWLLTRPLAGAGLVTLLGTGYTLFSEYRNVYLLHAWGYSPLMPRVAGIGVTPLLQWLILPGLTVLLVRRLWLRGAQTGSRHATNRTPR